MEKPWRIMDLSAAQVAQLLAMDIPTLVLPPTANAMRCPSYLVEVDGLIRT